MMYLINLKDTRAQQPGTAKVMWKSKMREQKEGEGRLGEEEEEEEEEQDEKGEEGKDEKGEAQEEEVMIEAKERGNIEDTEEEDIAK